MPEPIVPPGQFEPDWFRAALNVRPEPVETLVDGVVVRGRAWGPLGPGLVLIHGGAAHAGWWDHIGPMLGDTHRVVALDLSGHGDSDHREEYSLMTWADEVVAIAAAGGSTGAPIAVGHSMGGYVALAAGTIRPAAVRGVIAIDSPVPRRPPPPGLEPPAVREPTVESMRRRYASKEAAVRRFRVIPPDPYVLPYVAEHVANESVMCDDAGWTWKFDAASLSRDRELPPNLVADLSVPLALLRAEHGLMTSGTAAGMVAEYGRPAPVVELPGCGHHVPLDDPIALVVALRTVIAMWDSYEK